MRVLHQACTVKGRRKLIFPPLLLQNRALSLETYLDFIFLNWVLNNPKLHSSPSQGNRTVMFIVSSFLSLEEAEELPSLLEQVILPISSFLNFVFRLVYIIHLSIIIMYFLCKTK